MNSNRLRLLLQREGYLTTNGTAINTGNNNCSGLTTFTPDSATLGCLANVPTADWGAYSAIIGRL